MRPLPLNTVVQTAVYQPAINLVIVFLLWRKTHNRGTP